MSKLNIAVIGVGLGGQTHIRLMRDHPDMQLSAVVAPDSEKNHRIAGDACVPLFPHLENCLAQQKTDGVIIASPNQAHAAQATICIEAGLPVLIEKPITSTVEAGRELVELVQKKNARVLVGHHRAHNPILKIAKRAIHEGRLGRLVSVLGSAQFYKPDYYFEHSPWRKEIGGGPILINLIHEIDNLRRLIGDISAVQAIISNKTRGFVVEDTAVINLIFNNGVLGTFLLSDTAASPCSWEQTSGENPAFPTHPDEDCYLISGTKGSLAIPTMRLKYYADGITPSWWTSFSNEVLPVIRIDPLKSQLDHFAEVVRGTAPPLVTAEDGYKNLLITEAIKKSAIDNSIIKI